MSNDKIHIVEQTGAYEPPAELFKAAAAFKGERYFYMNKERTEWLIGIGHAYVIKADGRSPETVSRHYQALLERADSDHHVRLFGGFQFDDGESALFSGFGRSHFIWPKIQILWQGEELRYSYTDMTAEERANWRMPDTPRTPAVTSIRNLDEEKFLRNVSTAVGLMRQHAFEKVVLSRQKQVVASEPIDSAWLIENALKTAEHSYLVLLEASDRFFISRTPEQLVKVSDGTLMTNAIAGTMSRTVDAAEDRLLHDAKNLKEHDIVVRSIAADISPYTEQVMKPDSPHILANQFFYHLYTPIEAEIRTGDILTLSHALHPTPALGGYPKAAAARFIEEAEGDRGFYGAPLGYITPGFDGEFVVAIRSMLVQGDTATLFAGCGVVKDSIPEAELYETEIKFKPMLQLLGVSQ